jgi:hypothetical protein
MAEEVGAFLWREAVDQASEFFPECLDGADGLGAQQRLEFSKSHFDGIEIGTVGWDEQQACPRGLDRLAHATDLMRTQIVHNDDIAGFQGWDQDLLDIGAEHLTIDGAIEHARCGQTIAA